MKDKRGTWEILRAAGIFVIFLLLMVLVALGLGVATGTGMVTW